MYLVPPTCIYTCIYYLPAQPAIEEEVALHPAIVNTKHGARGESSVPGVITHSTQKYNFFIV
jgi:hypothetical protein